MEFNDVRAKFPQYKDLSDEQLAQALHKKFYADLPFDQFSKKIGYAQAAQPTAPKEPQSFIEGLGEAMSNVPASAGKMATDLLHAVSHPIQTAKGIVDIGAGALQAAFAPESFKGKPALYSADAEKAWDATVKFYKERYGSWNKFIESAKKDPVGVAMDVSAVTGGLGGAVRVAGAEGAANVLTKTSEVTNPLTPVVSAAKGVMRPAYSYAAGITTGSGAQAIKRALDGGDAFTQAMRGKISEVEVLDTARDALQKIKNERGAAYREQLKDIEASQKVLDISDIKAASLNWLNRYGVKVKKDGLDFDRSVLRNNPAAANEVQALYDTIKDWGTKAGDNTPLGLDTLKRIISDSYASQNASRAMVSSLAGRVKAKIVSEVPEYSKMTADYSKASDIIDDLNRGLGLSDKAATDTALRKLMSSMREDNTFRRGLMDTLDKTVGTDVGGAVAGLLMKNPWSNKLGPISHFYGTSAAAAYMHNPALLSLLPLASPRLMGEASRGLGLYGGALSQPGLYQLPYQAGRIPGIGDE